MTSISTHSSSLSNNSPTNTLGSGNGGPLGLTDDKQQINFSYANECDLEIHCSPFGLSGLYIKITGTNLMGIGSAMGLITGSTKGLIHYNDSNDLIDQKYKLYVIVDDEGMLRIDFTKIFTSQKDKADEKKSEVKEEPHSESSRPDSSSVHDGPKSVKQDGNEKYEEEEVPTLIFRGKCPEGRPDNIEPFIGIFSFERED